MAHKIKILGLAVSALMALGAFSAATAPASEFHSEVSHTILSGEAHAGEDTFTFNAGTARCQAVHYNGTMSTATTTTITLTPQTTGCKAFGFVNSTVDHNGCAYTFHTVPNTGNQAGTKTIECPAGQAITITAFNCWITLGPQGPLPGVTYTNQGSGKTRDITIDFNTTGIKYTQHSKSFPGCANGTFSNGTAVGSLTLKGSDTQGNQVGIWVH